ncbi:hypothetical protein ACIQNU_28715 [Streptomyces sp. NPDC091292]|uniref:LppU/SCO3897 family protein n=1 Tax=Streptomyces sp. NPDC091292 TaxID=3365991 RepID=UPI00382528EB
MTTPPPQGQNPFAQGQQPQGQNPYAQGQQPTMPQQPGQPGQPGIPQQPSPYFNQGGPVPPQPQRRNFKTWIRVGVVVVGLVVVAGAWLASRDDASTAKVGDCMSISNPDSSTDPGLEVVECSNSKAKYKVEEKKDDNSGCDRTKYSEYTETGGSKDFTLCLSDYKP